MSCLVFVLRRTNEGPCVWLGGDAVFYELALSNVIELCSFRSHAESPSRTARRRTEKSFDHIRANCRVEPSRIRFSTTRNRRPPDRCRTSATCVFCNEV